MRIHAPSWIHYDPAIDIAPAAGNQTLAQLLADARKQITVSKDDSGPLDRMAADFIKLLETATGNAVTKIQQAADSITGKLHDSVVEGQLQLRSDAIQRKGGFSTLDQTEIFTRLIDPAGLTMEQKLVMPDDQLQKYLPKDTIEHVKIFRQLNDDAHLLGWILATKGTKNGATISNVDLGGALRNTRTWKALQSVVKALTTTGSTTGAEWLPTNFSSQLIDILTVKLKVAAQFARITIPTNTFKVPIATSDDVAFLVPETTNDNLLNESNVYPKFTPTTSNVPFQAKKLAAICVFSEEAEEDSIIPLIPFLRMKIGNAMANAQERATLDGDTTSTHMDNDVTVATDARKTWKGLRYNILKVMNSTAGTTKDLSTFNLDNVRGLREIVRPAFAESPEELFYVTSVKVMLKMLKFPEFMTLDKYGPLATVVTGEVGRIDGSAVLTSKYSRDDVDATGVNSSGGPNTKSLLYLLNDEAWWYGDRREIKIDSARMIISGQGYLVISQRIDFKDIHPATLYDSAALGINI